jgi:RimJ/RimL family protein N-acetyltransferase
VRLFDLPAQAAVRQPCPVLETARLTLRAPRPEDAEAITLLANDRRIAENTVRIPHPYTWAHAEAFIALARHCPEERAFVIALRDGSIIGACGVSFRDGSAPELGYWLGVTYWGRGYATEAARAVIDHTFSEGPHGCLQAGARVTNPASRRVLEKCGFQWSGVGLYRIPALESSAPVDRFRLERSIWASLKSWSAARLVT